MFHVFVDGAGDGSPEAVRKLCEAIAQRYGLRAADLIGRMQKGRFRVKGNCDRATAESYARDLQALGARVSIEEATPANSRVTPQPFEAVKRPSSPLAGAAPARPQTPASPLAAVPPKPAAPAAGYQSGLAAAFSSGSPAASLGALENESFSLAGVDGTEAPVEAPPPPVKRVAAPGGKPDAKARKPKPKDEPVDLFMPPEAAGEAALKLDVAVEDVKKPSAPPPPAPVAAAVAVAAPPPAIAEAPPRASLLSHVFRPRPRFVAGLVLAILLGFIPAHLVARVREKSAFAEIDAKVEQLGQAAETSETYAELDIARDRLLEHKYGDRRSIALVALVIWAAAGAGIAYVWFKKLLPA